MSPVIGGSTIDEVEADELPEGLTLDELTPVETVTGTLRGLFDGYERFDDSYLVGEVADVSSSSEHLYFSISAATSGDTETLKCVIWGSQRDDIEVDIGSEMLVAVRGTLHFFESGGHPSLEVTDAHLVGESAYWQRIAQLRENLESEGLLDDERKSSLPRFPREIGIVTATGSDAEQDLIESIHSRYPSVDIRVQGSTVQGSSAPAELANAIETLDQSQVDVIVVARGGGSDTALRVFNEESVVRAVVDAETPTVAAIGHDADEPLIDEVADERVKTPTAAGDAVVIDREEFQTRLEEAAEGVDAAFDLLHALKGVESHHGISASCC
jgi:exodeoxyribonuclease VII large subunit